MPTKRGRVWKLLRRALIWAREGGVAASLHLLHDSIRSVRAIAPDTHRTLIRGERQLSFDDTPVFRFGVRKKCCGSVRRLLFPCIVDTTADHFSGGAATHDECRKSFLIYGGEAGEDDHGEVDQEGDQKTVDERADEFIARFYQQMKLQRQVSLLQYEEMMQRGLD